MIPLTLNTPSVFIYSRNSFHQCTSTYGLNVFSSPLYSFFVGSNDHLYISTPCSYSRCSTLHSCIALLLMKGEPDATSFELWSAVIINMSFILWSCFINHILYLTNHSLLSLLLPNIHPYHLQHIRLYPSIHIQWYFQYIINHGSNLLTSSISNDFFHICSQMESKVSDWTRFLFEYCYVVFTILGI